MLATEEPARLDAGRLQDLYVQLGQAAAEDVICRAMEELAVRMAQLERLYRKNKFDEMRKNARCLVAIAEQVGMGPLATVARDVTNCIDTCDDVALAAVLARLLRLGERSLMAVWDTQDLSV